MKYRILILVTLCSIFLSFGYSQAEARDIVENYIKSGYSVFFQYEYAVKKDKEYIHLAEESIFSNWPDYFSEWINDNTELKISQINKSTTEVLVNVKSIGASFNKMIEDNKNMLVYIYNKYFPEIDILLNDSDDSVKSKYYEEYYRTLYNLYKSTEIPIEENVIDYKCVKEGKFWKIDFMIYEKEIELKNKINIIREEIINNILVVKKEFYKIDEMNLFFEITLINESNYIPREVTLKFQYFNDQNNLIGEDSYKCWIMFDKFKPGYVIDEIVLVGQYGISRPPSLWNEKDFDIQIIDIELPYDFNYN